MAGMTKALLIADVPGWAFDINNRCIAKYAIYDWDVEYLFIKDLDSGRSSKPDWTKFGAVFTPYHRWSQVSDIPRERRLGSLRSQWFVAELPGPPTVHDLATVNRHVRFHFVNRNVFDLVSPYCPGAVYLTNPVDTEVFDQVPDMRREIVCQWNGNSMHGRAANKGLDIIMAACEYEKVPLLVREFTLNRVEPIAMPLHYKCANVALCGSMHEGASNSVMEAMACGQALVTTDCGNAREMQESQIMHLGETGIVIVDRSVDSFRKALVDLRDSGMKYVTNMGALNRMEIQDRWSWKVWASKYRNFFGMDLR